MARLLPAPSPPAGAKREIEVRYPYSAPLGECKVKDWGVLEGRLVLLDYGAECFTEPEIAAARATLRRYVDRAEAERLKDQP